MSLKQRIKVLSGIHLNNHDYLQIGYALSARHSEKHCFLWRKILRRRFNILGVKYGLEIPTFDNIGDNMSLGHPFCITVNPRASLGNDVLLCKGCTIGSVRSGPRCGVPKIGDRVVVGINAFVCGNITVGNDVLIAANSFVDFDVPDNSLVIGNPGTIHHKEKASKDYIKQDN